MFKKWVNKQTVTVFIVALIITSIVPIYAATTQAINVTYRNIQISVNGTIVPSDTEPFIYNGRTFLPVRAIAEALNKDVKYNEVTDTVEITDKVDEVSQPKNAPINSTPETQPIQSEPTPVITVTQEQKVTTNGLNGIVYNDTFYAETTDIVNKYNIQLVNKSTICTIVSAKTGEMLKLEQTTDGFVKDSNGYYYLNYNTIKPLLDVSPKEVINNTPSNDSIPSDMIVDPNTPILTPAEVDKLPITTQNDLSGATYNGTFYVEQDNFCQKYKMSTHIIEDFKGIKNTIMIVNGLTGTSLRLQDNISGYLKNSNGTIYLNYDKVKTLIWEKGV